MEKLQLAEVLKPQGIKGEIKFRLLARGTEEITNAKSLFLENLQVSIATFRESNGFLYIKFNEINSITEAEKYRGCCLLTAKEEVLENLEDGIYLIADLLDKEVVFESGESVGILTDVQNFGSADVMYIKKANGKELLFSNVEGVILKVDSKIIVNEKRFREVSV